jgi:hypothetical protein
MPSPLTAIEYVWPVACGLTGVTDGSMAYLERELHAGNRSSLDVRAHSFGARSVMPAYATASAAIGPSLWAHHGAGLVSVPSPSPPRSDRRTVPSPPPTASGGASARATRHDDGSGGGVGGAGFSGVGSSAAGRSSVHAAPATESRVGGPKHRSDVHSSYGRSIAGVCSSATAVARAVPECCGACCILLCRCGHCAAVLDIGRPSSSSRKASSASGTTAWRRSPGEQRVMHH